MKRAFAILVLFLLVLVVFTGSGYLYLSHTNGLYDADQSLSNIPYSSTPEDAVIIFEINERFVYFHFGFSGGTLTVIPYYTDKADFSKKNCFFMNANENTVAGIIDRLGGLELDIEGSVFRYTGIQVTQILYGSKQSDEIRREILIATLNKIGREGFDRQDFVYLIENTETNLTIPDCFYWPDNIKSLFENFKLN